MYQLFFNKDLLLKKKIWIVLNGHFSTFTDMLNCYKLFLNVYQILKIGAMLSVTVADIEWSFLTLALKPYLMDSIREWA